MRTKAHWDECKTLPSYHAAQNLAWHLRTNMSCQKLHGIKVLSKEEVNRHNGYADAQVIWHDGPEDWALNIKLLNVPGICAEVDNGYTISFYDI